MPKNGSVSEPLQLWGGVECTVNRVGDHYFDQIECSGHVLREGDLDRIASLGVTAVRYAALWEHVSPVSPDECHWEWLDRRFDRLRELNVEPIAGLVHHGSGPRYTALHKESFAPGLARHARNVAERFPWISAYTPVNEPLTTARFSGLYGLWYPHRRDDETFVRCLINECKATVLSMREIRKVNPQAKLIQTEDLGKTHSTRRLRYQAAFENQRRWFSWDLLCGRVEPYDPFWSALNLSKQTREDLLWFKDNPCPPDILGVNYYVTSERFLDEDTSQYPPHLVGGNGRDTYVDIEAVRVRREGIAGAAGVLREAWDRYGIPLAITEAHLGCTREEQQRWLLEVWNGAKQVREEGVDVRAVTMWSLFGAFNWSCLLTSNEGCYEPGAFDVRSPEPRETGLVTLARTLASGEEPNEPALAQPGWWRRDIRYEYLPKGSRSNDVPLNETRPILITGATGTLGQAFARLCELRGLTHRLLTRQDMDITNASQVCDVVAGLQPWLVVNAAGYVRVDDAETDIERCMAENGKGPAILAGVCAEHGCKFVTFSSDLVFDGSADSPYLEEDHPNPLNVYGRSKALSERVVLARLEEALVIRTSAFFGPWDEHNFLYRLARSLRRGEPFYVADNGRISPTYVPHLVHATLDLAIDGAKGIWHLSNQGELTWLEFGKLGARSLGLDASLVREGDASSLRARRPAYSALSSSRASTMPTVERAISLYARAMEAGPRSRAYVS
jgi:dTDP-4-dehydrorhamnose reductase